MLQFGTYIPGPSPHKQAFSCENGKPSYVLIPSKPSNTSGPTLGVYEIPITESDLSTFDGKVSDYMHRGNVYFLLDGSFSLDIESMDLFRVNHTFSPNWERIVQDATQAAPNLFQMTG